MALAENVYRSSAAEHTTNAYGGSVPHTREGELVRRTRERPKRRVSNTAEAGSTGLSMNEFRQIVTAIVLIGVLLIGTLVLNAYATSIQYNINSLTKQNLQLENDIKTLNLKIDAGTSIEKIESYATSKLKMSYPKSSQVIHIEEGTSVADNFADVLRKKAYE